MSYGHSKLHTLAEIHPLQIRNSNRILKLTLDTQVKDEIANRFAYRITALNKFLFESTALVVGNQIYVMSVLDAPRLSSREWHETLEKARKHLNISRRLSVNNIEEIHSQELESHILAQLALNVISLKNLSFTYKREQGDFKSRDIRDLIVNIASETRVEVFRNTSMIQVRTKCLLDHVSNFSQFFKGKHWKHIEQLVEKEAYIVRPLQDTSGRAKIIDFIEWNQSYIEELVEKTSKPYIKKIIEKSDAIYPIAVVQFNDKRDAQNFNYVQESLKPFLSPETAKAFGLDYGSILKECRRDLPTRANHAKQLKEQINKCLGDYGLKLDGSVNTKSNEFVHYFFKYKKACTVKFGNNVVKDCDTTGIQLGLKNAGCYYVPPEFAEKVLQIAVLNFSNKKATSVIQEMCKLLDEWKVKNSLFTGKMVKLDRRSIPAEVTLDIQREVNALIAQNPELVMVVLPDPYSLPPNAPNVYQLVYRQLLDRNIATQFLEQSTLQKCIDKKPNFIVKQLALNVLSKLAFLPYVLNEPLAFDCVVGVDIGRRAKKKSSGSINVAAGTRLFGKNGEFIEYCVKPDMVEGETLSADYFRTLLDSSKFSNKKILIMRDGNFQAGEYEAIEDWLNLINSSFCAIECIKSGNPRIYNFAGIGGNFHFTPPNKGDILDISDTEKIIVTTDVRETIGLAHPLRIKYIGGNMKLNWRNIIHTVMSLTYVNYSSFGETRLPAPIHASHKISEKLLDGICPPNLVGNRQWFN
jgi:hypothetical protein